MTFRHISLSLDKHHSQAANHSSPKLPQQKLTKTSLIIIASRSSWPRKSVREGKRQRRENRTKREGKRMCVCVCVCLCVGARECVFVFVCVCVSLSLSLFFSLCVCLSVCLSVCRGTGLLFKQKIQVGAGFVGDGPNAVFGEHGFEHRTR